MDKATTFETMTLTVTALMVMGLDDIGRVPDVARRRDGSKVICTGERSDLLYIVQELNDRATEGDGGYGETARDKAVCRRAVKAAARQGFHL